MVKTTRRSWGQGAESRRTGYLSLMNLLRPDERDVTVNGLKLRVLDWGGEGRPHLLLLHGFTGHAHAWDTLAIALQPHFHAWALDQRGHGDSDPADVYGPVAAFGGRRHISQSARRTRRQVSPLGRPNPTEAILGPVVGRLSGPHPAETG
jgi:hypothetical protein